jgi:chromosome segregation ATPase
MLLFGNSNPKLTKKHKELFDNLENNLVKLIELTTSNKELLNENKELNNLIQKYKIKIFNLEKNIKDLESERIDLKKLLKKKVKPIQRARMTDNINNTQNLDQQIDDYVNLIKEYTQTKKKMTEQIQQLKKMNHVMGKNYDDINQKLQLQIKENHKLTEEKNELTEENFKLTDKNHKLTEKKNELIEENNKLTEEKNELTEENEILTKNNKKLKDTLTHYFTTITELDRII